MSDPGFPNAPRRAGGTQVEAGPSSPGTASLGSLEPLLERLADLVAERVVARLNGAGGGDHPRDAEEADQLLSAGLAAARLGVSRRWLYRRAVTLPFTRRLGPKTLRFSASGLERWLSRRRTQP